jgi:hypothetical protein
MNNNNLIILKIKLYTKLIKKNNVSNNKWITYKLCQHG